MNAPREGVRRLEAILPHGKSLPEEQWRTRHRALVWLLWAHAVVLPIVALLHGMPLLHALACGGVIAAFGVLAELKLGGRRTRSLVVVFGLLTCSAALVHITGGLIEAHFHFFVMVAALSLYEDWTPFLVSVAFVLLQHGIMAALVDHDAVFNHAGSSWKWAAVHSGFIAALSVALVVNWRASEAQRAAFRSLVDTLDEGVVMVARDGSLAASNPSAGRILGMDPAAILRPNGSDPAWMLVGAEGDPLPDAERPLRHTARTGEPRLGVPLGLRRADGAVRWLSISTRAADADADAPPPYTVVVSFADVTEERETVNALERSNAELQQFAYIASHDLSEPLRMVSSYLQLLRRRSRGQLDSEADEFIDYAVDGATRMRGLIEALLAYSRAGRGDEPVTVEMGRVAADVLRTLAGAIVRSSAQIQIGELPRVVGDRVQLEQLLQNLIGNALKFRREGVPPEIEVAATVRDGLAEVTIRDNGLGFDPQYASRIFRAFERLHGTSAYPGTGIGLALCRKIVERHHGTITADSTVGSGATFTITLPVEHVAAPPPTSMFPETTRDEVPHALA
jgi:PAS domain S-box-containing protein